MKPETFLLYPMIRILWSLLAICLAANNLIAQGSKQGAKIRFSVTRFDPMDRPAPEFMVKNGAKDDPGESALDLYRRSVQRHLEG